MKLQLISAQGGDIDAFYQEYVSPDFDSYLLERVEVAREFLLYLQQEVEGPDQWLTISHLVFFYLSDEDDWKREKARVFFDFDFDLGSNHCHVKYRSKRELDWAYSFTRFTAKSQQEAGRLIVQALKHAKRNLSGRGEE